MNQSTINQRLKFLIEKLELSVRSFSALAEVSPNNTQNYLGKRQIKPKREYLDQVMRHFSHVNEHWLLTGEGEPFKEGEAPVQNQTNISGKKNAVNVSGTNNGTATQNNFTLDDCQRDLQAANEKIRLLTSQLADKERTIQILMRQGS